MMMVWMQSTENCLLMKTLKAAENEIIEAFENLPDIDAKYAHLFRLGEDMPAMAPSLKNDDTLVRGCQSKLWFYLDQDAGRCYLQADSDSMVIKGIAALLVRLIHGRRADEIKNISMNFIDKLEIWKLASNRNNGLMAMLEHIHNVARSLEQGESTAVRRSAQS